MEDHCYLLVWVGVLGEIGVGGEFHVCHHYVVEVGGFYCNAFGGVEGLFCVERIEIIHCNFPFYSISVWSPRSVSICMSSFTARPAVVR